MDKTLKIAVLLLFTFFFGLDSNGQDYLPSSTTNQLVEHTNYTLSYSEAHEQAEWVAYRLTSSMVSGSQSRTDNFRPDPMVTTGSATLADYKGSGYCHVHQSQGLGYKAPNKLAFHLMEGVWQRHKQDQGVKGRLRLDLNIVGIISEIKRH